MQDFLGGNPDQSTQNKTTEPPASTNEAPFEAPAWLKGVPEELVKEPSVKNLPDLQSLVKSYVSAQKMIGAEKVVIPKKDATAEQWGEFYKKLGMPEQLEKYALTKDEKSKMDGSFFDAFKLFLASFKARSPAALTSSPMRLSSRMMGSGSVSNSTMPVRAM